MCKVCGTRQVQVSRVFKDAGYAKQFSGLSKELKEQFWKRIREDGSKEKKISELDQDEKLVYAMKCFVAMEGGTEKTLLKNIFEWWCSDPMEMEVYEPTEDDLRREVENGTSDVSEGSSGDDEE